MFRTYDSTSCYFKDDTVAIRLKVSLVLLDAACLPPTKDFHTPNAVPSKASFPTRMGIDAMKVMALVLSAKELSKIGASG
jgi:hypothetical protein